MSTMYRIDRNLALRTDEDAERISHFNNLTILLSSIKSLSSVLIVNSKHMILHINMITFTKKMSNHLFLPVLMKRSGK